MNDQEITSTELVLRERLQALAAHAPSAVPALDALPMARVDRSRRRVRRRAGMAVALTAILGAAGITTVTLAGGGTGDGGARSPEAAVLDLVSAVEADDVLGVLDVLDPSERDALRAALESLDSQAKRLELVDGTFSLSGVAGVDVDVKDLVLETEELESNLAVVHLRGGSVQAAIDPMAFPIGTAIGDIGKGKVGAQLEFADADAEVFVATVARDGRWYVSVSYTVAELARRAAGVEITEPGAAVRPEGFATPTAAADAMLARLVALDLPGVVATAAPGEGDALARYAPLLFPAFARSVDGSRAEGLALAIHDVTWDTAVTGDRAQARATGYTLEGTLPAQWFSSQYERPPFDPTLPTVITLFDEPSLLVIAAGQPIPDVIDDAMPRVSYGAVPPGAANYANVGPDGTITPGWSEAATAGPSAPLAFTLVKSGECSTVSGPLTAMLAEGNTYSPFGSGPEPEIVNDTVRYCVPAGSALQQVLGLAALPFTLPRLTLVRHAGEWYVSPLGSLVGVVVDALSNIASAAGRGIDGPLALWLLSTNRELLERQLEGSSSVGLTAECVAISEFDATGLFVRVVADPDLAAVRVCAWSGGYVTEPSGDPAGNGTGWSPAPAPEGTDVNAPATTAAVPESTTTGG